MKFNFLFILALLFSIVSNNFQAKSENDLSNLNKLFFKTLNTNNIQNNKSQSDQLKLIGVNNLSVPKALIEINGITSVFKLNEEKNGYYLKSINGTLVKIIKNEEILKLRIGELITVNVQITSKFSTNLILNKDKIKTNDELIIAELKRHKENANKKIENINFTDFERKVVSKILEIPGRTAIGRLGWKMPSKILGQPLHQIGLKKDDVIITINNIPVDQIGFIYKQYKDPSVTKFVLEIQRSDKVIALEWER